MCTEVCDLGVHLGVQEDVLRLEVSVHHHVSVAVVHRRDDLLKQPPALLLLQLSAQKHDSTLEFRACAVRGTEPRGQTGKRHSARKQYRWIDIEHFEQKNMGYNYKWLNKSNAILSKIPQKMQIQLSATKNILLIKLSRTKRKLLWVRI